MLNYNMIRIANSLEKELNENDELKLLEKARAKRNGNVLKDYDAFESLQPKKAVYEESPYHDDIRTGIQTLAFVSYTASLAKGMAYYYNFIKSNQENILNLSNNWGDDMYRFLQYSVPLFSAALIGFTGYYIGKLVGRAFDKAAKSDFKRKQKKSKRKSKFLLVH